MHIAVFYQYFNNPDCAATGRHYTLARHLAQRHRVTMVTSRAWHDRRLTQRYDWVPPGVTLHMLNVPYDNRMTVRRRLFAFLHYAAGAVLKSLTLDRPDVIVGVSTPLTAAWAAAVAARLRRVPWVFEVKDLWPDFPIQMGAITSPWLQRRLCGLETSLYRRAAHVVTLSPDMEAHVVGRGIAPDKVTTLVNGTDFDLLATEPLPDTIRQIETLGSRAVILYAGTFGRANDIPTLIETARRLAHRDDLVFVFLGHGYYEEVLHQAAATQANLVVISPQPRHQVLHWFRHATVSLVPFLDLPVLAANSPAKFFDSLAAGTPVIVTNPGWTKRFVEEHGCGWYVPASAPAVLAQRLATLLDSPAEIEAAGTRGAEISRARFDRIHLAERLEDIVLRVARSGS